MTASLTPPNENQPSQLNRSCSDVVMRLTLILHLEIITIKPVLSDHPNRY